MKGIILAAGKGTRLYPITKPICKPLLPVFDKPLIYFPLAVLMLAGIRDVLIIVPSDGKDPFEKLLGDGRQLGISITYKEQKVQRGIADAFIIGESFILNDSVCLILGDNIFHGDTLVQKLIEAQQKGPGATIFGYYVDDPRPFGVVEFDSSGSAISIEEKPLKPKSHFIVPGLYFYDNRVVEMAKRVKPSGRGELEITSVNNAYLEMGALHVIQLNEEFIWEDAGTAESLLDSANTVRAIQRKTGKYIACLEEIAYDQGYISKELFEYSGEGLKMTLYGQYILSKGHL